jgi:rhomboid protease GluP
MSDPAADPLETILRQCAAAAPQPWYPSAYARAQGIPRDDLDSPLERLRLGGLVRLTDWVQGQGQGYALTPEGAQLLERPRELARLRAGKVPVPPSNGFRRAAPAADIEQRPWARGDEVRDALLNPGPTFVTRGLVFLNAVFFVAGLCLAAGDADGVSKFLAGTESRIIHQIGGVDASDLLHHEWWRLLTGCFVHIGLLHLASNMIVLIIEGRYVERMYWPGRFLLLYLLSGFVGSCAGVIGHPIGGCAGASGAICGLIAGEFIWLILNRGYLPPALASRWIRRLTFMAVIIAIFSFTRLPGGQRISAAGHFGGAAAGLLAGFLLHFASYGTRTVRILAILGLVAMPIGSVAAFWPAKRLDPRWESLAVQDQTYTADVKAAEREAVTVYKEKALPLQKLPPSKRDPAAVAEAIAALGQAGDLLAGAVEQVRQAGPYPGPQTEEERLKVLANLEQMRYETEVIASELKTDEVYQERLGPLSLLPPASWSPGTMATVAADLSAARAQSYGLAQQIRNAAPWSDPAAEESRQKLLADVENANERLDFREASTVCLQWARSVEESATQTQRSRAVQKLLASQPTAREAASVRSTTAALETDQARLLRTADVLQQVLPYADPVVEKTRQLTEQFLQALARQLALDARELGKGMAQSPDEAQERTRHEQQTAELRQALNRQIRELNNRGTKLFGQQ